ncbi:MAG: Arabinose 5-phosphate isomerase KdsD [Calditrichaeota bacterium]|nr:Arabinose 5-phosphate isomerase KdsD [Calditrichota bacterium]
MTTNDIITRAREIFRVETDAATEVSDRLNDTFVRTVRAILDTPGKVVLVGAGKSGLIAQKIAATLRSTGIVALFLHPSDAAHGDLGMVSERDVVILISKSGETEEVRDLIPALRRKRATIIAMVGEESSRIAREADIWLDVGVEREACPIGLAPTSSTTVTMLMGDALSAVLMQLRGLTPEDFAINHPGGSLGKRLLLDVSDLMHGGANNPTCAPATPMSEVLVELTRTALGGISVVNGDGRVAGIITDGDVRRGLQRLGKGFLDADASAVMTADPIRVHARDKAIDALLLMENRPSQIMVLPVVDDGEHCVGMLRLHDLIRAGLRPSR